MYIFHIHMRRDLILKRALIRQCYKFTTCRLLRANVICHFVVGAGELSSSSSSLSLVSFIIQLRTTPIANCFSLIVMDSTTARERASSSRMLVELPTTRTCRIVLLLLIWLLLVIYTCCRQLYAHRSRARIARIKRLQYEVRKKLKREQQGSDKLREKLHANARKSVVQEPCELNELRTLRCQIDAQLEQLESILKELNLQ